MIEASSSPKGSTTRISLSPDNSPPPAPPAPLPPSSSSYSSSPQKIPLAVHNLFILSFMAMCIVAKHWNILTTSFLVVQDERRLSLPPSSTSTSTNSYSNDIRSNIRSLTKKDKPKGPQQREQRDKIDVVIAHCHENLSWLDQFGSCDHVNFHVYSKCQDTNATSIAFQNVSDCVTIHHIDNCGTQEYAFFLHVIERYDHDNDYGSNNDNGLTPMTAFIQSDSLSENPHIIHDILNYIPGTTYTELARVVKGTWHFPKKSNFEHWLHNSTVPRVYKHGMWMNGWRAMYMASRDTLRRVDRNSYLEFNKYLCNKWCYFINCDWEGWFAPIYGCTDVLFEKKNDDTTTNHDHEQDECDLVESQIPFSRTVIPEDYKKDTSVMYGIANTVTRRTCGTRTILYSMSDLNGLLTCIDTSSSSFSSGGGDGGAFRYHNDASSSSTSSTGISDTEWLQLLNEANNETIKVDLSGVTWGVTRRWEKKDE